MNGVLKPKRRHKQENAASEQIDMSAPMLAPATASVPHYRLKRSAQPHSLYATPVAEALDPEKEAAAQGFVAAITSAFRYQN
jgi:hypothetical protein